MTFSAASMPIRMSTSSTVWLKYWSEDSETRKHPTSFYIGIYATLQSLALTTLLFEAAVGMLVIIRLSGANSTKPPFER